RRLPSFPTRRSSDLRHYPISIEVAATTRLAFSHSVLVEERKLREWRPEHLIVRIDRTDPSKNIVRGFLAYEKLLDYHPELKGHVDRKSTRLNSSHVA